MDLATLAATPILARERTFPVAAPFRTLLPDGGLGRGRVVSCAGPAAPSLALALLADPVAAGCWLAAVDLPWLGVEAAAELGIDPHRVVRIDSRRTVGWAQATAAALDGFDLVLTQPPARTPAGQLRRVGTRVQARSALLVLIGTAGSPDITLTTTDVRWEQAAHGHGHLIARQVQIEATGRRIPRTRRANLWLPDPHGHVTATEPASAAHAAEARPALRTAG